MHEPVRVRFAPSPTGYLHVGNLRTALYDYLLARRFGGSWVLRIEDTDRTRQVEGAEQSLMTVLRWCGLEWDEGPDKGGPYGPYRQSERLPLYQAAIHSLLVQGHAYPCFCTSERLEAMRQAAKAEGREEKYDRTCLQLDTDVIRSRLAAGEPHTVRLRVPAGETLLLDDLIRGHVEFQSDLVDDQVLLKSDGFPTYHLAVVVDDHEMRITHVLRGEEWLSSAPKHLLLYRFLGYPLPQFAHLPLILNADRSKLSKRQGNVAVEDYRDQGYFPEALANFIAFLGWNPGHDREILSLAELAQEFSLERVGKSGAVFNREKLRWFNEQYLKAMPGERLLTALKPILAARGWADHDDDFLTRVIDLMRERATFVHEIPEKAGWFFADPAEYEEATVKKRWKPESADWLRAFVPVLESLGAFDHATLESAGRAYAEGRGGKLGDLVHPLRLAVTGVGGGPGLFELMEVLGRPVCRRRIGRALQTLG